MAIIRDDEQSEYELQRQKRIAENEAMFKDLFPDGPITQKRKQRVGKVMRPNSVKIDRKLSCSPYPSRKNPSRSCRRTRRVRYGSDCEDNDRSSDFEVDEQTDTFDDDNDDCKQGSMVVKLWGSKKNFIDSPEKKRRRYVFLNKNF